MSGFVKGVQAGKWFPELSRYIERRTAEFAQIPQSRKADLEQLSDYTHHCLAEGRRAELVFICTHNSRRSHFGQLWAKLAALHFDVAGVQTYSGGTEVTAFNRRAVAALQRCGLEVTAEDSEAENPHYQVWFGGGAAAELCFSKRFDAPSNPAARFCAVMTCGDADRACPNVTGCDRRIAITYEDPKAADETPAEQAVYDQRCQQISREMLYALSRVGS